MALQAKADTVENEISHFAGRARVPVDVALPSRRLAFDAECEAFTIYDIDVGRRVPNGVAQLRKQGLDREGWLLRLLPHSLFSTGAPQDALRELLG